MASIWIQHPKGAPIKLAGNMHPHQATTAFKREVRRVGRELRADVVYCDHMNALLKPKPVDDVLVVGDEFSMWIEPLSPPSAPEPNQPKLLFQGTEAVDGILVTAKGAFTVGVPSHE